MPQPAGYPTQYDEHFYKRFSDYSAITIMVFTRTELGRNMIKPADFTLIAVALMGLSLFGFIFLSFTRSFTWVPTHTELRAVQEYDQQPPANWQRMTIPRRRAWAQQHIVTHQKQVVVPAHYDFKRAQLAFSDAVFPSLLFFAAVVVAGMWHRIQARRALNRQEFQHTKNRGFSRLYNAPVIYRLPWHYHTRFLEPLAALAVAVIIYPFTPVLSWWLAIAALGLFISENHFLHARTDQVFEQIDVVLKATAYQRETINDVLGMQRGPAQTLNIKFEKEPVNSKARRPSGPLLLKAPAKWRQAWAAFKTRKRPA